MKINVEIVVPEKLDCKYCERAQIHIGKIHYCDLFNDYCKRTRSAIIPCDECLEARKKRYKKCAKGDLDLIRFG